MDEVARFLRDVEPLWTAEKPVSFDPVQTTFLQKLVRESALQGGVTIRKEDFFAGIVFADYFMEVIAARTTLIDDVKVLVEELEKIDPYLDTDLELLVRYTGIYIGKDLKGEGLFKPNPLSQIARRHEKTNTAVTAGGGPADLFDRAVARMLLDLTRTAPVQAYLPKVASRNDLRAAILADAVIAALPGGAPADALASLERGEIVPCVTSLLAALVAASKDWSLRSHVEHMARRHAGS